MDNPFRNKKKYFWPFILFVLVTFYFLLSYVSNYNPCSGIKNEDDFVRCLDSKAENYIPPLRTTNHYYRIFLSIFILAYIIYEYFRRKISNEHKKLT